MLRDRKTIFLIWALPLFFIFSGCATVRNPVPFELLEKVTIKDMAEVRVIGGQRDTRLQENLLESIKEEKPGDFPVHFDGIKVYPILIISGGGANGAYGAGLLKGWSAEGSRPVFKVVTGVSTGAIIAPFAFLGKDYDPELEKYYTTTTTKDVLIKKWILSAFLGDSFVSTKPLAESLARVFDDDIIAKVAAEHRRGRRLLVGTTNLDAQRFVVWDLGAIACRGEKELFRKVILASASIPTMFPPVYFQVEEGGMQYDEMHVDGGTLTQAFGIYKLLEHMEGAAKQMGINPAKLKARIYIIRNGYVSPYYETVKNSLASIASRSVDTMINSQGVGDTYRIYVFAQKRGSDYNLAFIPSDFRPKVKEPFDPVGMKRLFDRGYQDAAKGYHWHKTPPGDLDNAE